MIVAGLWYYGVAFNGARALNIARIAGISDGRMMTFTNLCQDGGKSEVKEASDGRSDDGAGDGGEGEEAGEGAEEEDEAGTAGHVEQVGRPRDPTRKLESSGWDSTII